MIKLPCRYARSYKNGTQAYELAVILKKRQKDNISLSTEAKLALQNIKLGFKVMYEASKQNYDISRDQMMAEMVTKPISFIIIRKL